MLRSHQPIRIINGRVIDPTREGSVTTDLYLAHGQVRPCPPAQSAAAADARRIDARGQLVLPGAIDMHTHVVSGGVELARTQNPGLIGTARELAHAYCRMGYTSIIDAAVPVDEVDRAHDALDAMDNVDSGFLLAVETHRPLLKAIDEEGEEAAIGVIEDLLAWSGAYGIKLVNPGLIDSLDEPITGTWVTARRMIEVCATAADRLELPHAVHVHLPRLGTAGNVELATELLDHLGDRRLHLAHAQFSAYGQDDRDRLCSGVEKLIKSLEKHPQITLDSGCISFGPAMMISRDTKLAQRLATALKSQAKTANGWSVLPMRYAEDHPINALQWAMGLELCLAGAHSGRVTLSVDHPNGGSFTRMLDLLRLLADGQARTEALGKVHGAAAERSGLSNHDESLPTEELVRLTRTAPARALGLPDKGHLSIGAAADVVITPAVAAMPTMVIKGGQVVVEHGEVVADVPGKRLTAIGERCG